MSRPSNAACLLVAVVAATPLPAQLWENRNQLLVDAVHPQGAQLGSSLAVGDFDADGRDDLAAGAPHETVSALADAGRVRVFLSAGASGLVSSNASIAGTETSMRLGTAIVAGDFDGNGRDELVVGAPGDDTTGPIAEAGSIRVWSLSGSVWSQVGYFDQDSASVPGGAEPNDHFGSTLTVGDFDDDGYDDLAIGVPDEDVGSTVDAGAVCILYGSASGLTGTASQLWYRSGGGIDGTAGTDQVVGRALASGDFDGDQIDDLAIGAYDTFAGHVVVLFGSGTGIGAAGQQAVYANDLPQDPGGNGFGVALAAGDLDPNLLCLLNQTCADELVVGMDSATVVLPNNVSMFGAGAAFVLFGSTTFGGLDPATAVELTQNELARFDGPGAYEGFGAAVAVGSLGGGSAVDIAIGDPDEDLATPLSGTATILLSGSAPLASGTSQAFWQRPGLLSDPPKGLEHLGTALAIGDFDDDGRGDLAIGIPGKAVGGNGSAGAVQVLYQALFADAFESQSESNWSNF